MNVNVYPKSSRLLWIDYMKVIGIYLIILGHFFSYGNEYIYTFSVPLFFAISGFLCHPGESKHIYLKKTLYNLVIPMLIIFATLTCREMSHSIKDGSFSFINLLTYIVFGFAGYYKSLGILWFVYTLIVLKLIYIISYKNIYVQILLLISLSIIGIYSNQIKGDANIAELEENANGLMNICVAYPFFFLGNVMSRFRTKLNTCNHHVCELIITALATIAIYMCGKFNGLVLMYVNGYGANFSLFLLGGIAGITLTFVISKWIGRYDSRVIKLLSKGTMLILGYHMILKGFMRAIFPNVSWLDFLLAFIILLLFIPIISRAERYFPIILGKYRK